MGLKNISSKSAPLMDNICYLISDEGTETLCFCAELPVQSNEFFRAGQTGIKPEICLAMDSESYNEQDKIKYNDTQYTIYRIYAREDGITELYCNRRLGGYYE
jgi:SPP1 family predicted phage head-tail adaptor